MATRSHREQEIIAALNMIDSRARGFFWKLTELVVLTGLVGLELPGRGKYPVYSATQAHKCQLTQGVKPVRTSVYFLANEEKMLPHGGEKLNQSQYDHFNEGRPDVTEVSHSARAARAAAAAEARLAEVGL